MRRGFSVGLVSTSSLAASGLALLLFVGAGRSLDSASFADFAAVWGAVFGLAAVLGAIELEAARQAAAREDTGPLTRTAAALGAILAIVGALATPVIADALRLSQPLAALAVPGALAAYPLLFVVRGTLAGRDRLKGFAGISLLENALRLGPAIPTVLSGTTRFTTPLAIGPLAFVPWMGMVVPPIRQRWSWTETQTQIARISPLLSGNLAGALLITGMPATAIIVLGDTDAVGISAAVALSTISRAPLVLLSSIYGLFVPWFVRRGHRGIRLTRRQWIMLAATAGGFLVLSAAATVVGARFAITAHDQIGVAVGLGFATGALCLGILQLATARLVAADRKRDVQTMWWSAAISTLIVMVFSRVSGIDVVLSLAAAQLGGPLVGLAVAIRKLTGLGSLPSGEPPSGVREA